MSLDHTTRYNCLGVLNGAGVSSRTRRSRSLVNLLLGIQKTQSLLPGIHDAFIHIPSGVIVHPRQVGSFDVTLGGVTAASLGDWKHVSGSLGFLGMRSDLVLSICSSGLGRLAATTTIYVRLMNASPC